MSLHGNGAILIAYLAAAVATCALTPAARALAVRAGALDHPNERKVHTTPVATWGGLAIVAGFLLGGLVAGGLHQIPARALVGVVAGGVMVAFVGFADDRVDISAKIKLLLQVICVLPLLLSGLTISMLSHPLVRGVEIILPVWLSWIITTVWVIAVTNAINLIDGLDGLAAGVAAICCVSLAFIALLWGQFPVAFLCAALAGAAVGFLPWNWHPARIIMGDTGAYFLGYVIAAVTIQGAFKMAAAIAIFVPLLVLAVPLFDTVLSPLRRFLRGRHPFAADRDHLHHRLVALGLSQPRVVLSIYAVTTVCGAVAIWMSRTG
jgi:UDP-GlcNAc:undecaprenyl-phosphate GlcNAc-1-phosphate transferase